MPQATTNRAAWVVLVTIGLILLIAALIVPPKSKTPPPPPPPPADARAVVLPADGVTRTVVIPRCGSTSKTALGYVRFQVTGARSVLVPDCSAPANPAPGAPQQAAAFLLPVGANRLIDRSVGLGIRQQVLVPANSKATTVVVPACAKGTTVRPNAKHQDVILSPASGPAATAPAC